MKYIVRGRVQGVGYRNWCCGKAREMKLSGWVRNLNDGSVEVVVTAGDDSALEGELRKGPLLARVTDVERSPSSALEQDATGTFEIR
jgi:acylphosphatase